MVCECLITVVAPLEVGDGKEKDRREIKIASGVPKVVLKECVCILPAIGANVTNSDGLLRCKIQRLDAAAALVAPSDSDD